MGYYTNFRLDFDNNVPDEQVLLDQLTETTNYTWSGFYLDDVKWYDYEKHMKSISKLYPDTVFSLCGDGEEEDDMWIQYFKNGKSQYARAKIVFDEFDENKLED